MAEIIHHEDGSITVPVRTPEGMSTVTVTVDDVRKSNDEMWKWVLGELAIAVGIDDPTEKQKKIIELYERLRRW